MDEKKDINEMTAEELRQELEKAKKDLDIYKMFYLEASKENESYKNKIDALRAILKVL